MELDVMAEIVEFIHTGTHLSRPSDMTALLNRPFVMRDNKGFLISFFIGTYLSQVANCRAIENKRKYTGLALDDPGHLGTI